ncbi:MAG: UbiD family decarboxylase [Actinobacteria bacterium]|nr:UbiD family decarboxylase [Actinomycetota bacterium]
MPDLPSYLAAHASSILHVEAQVPLDAVGALTAQADRTIVFEDIAGFPGWRLADLLFVDRAAQARVLGCRPGEVVPRLAKVLRDGPRPLKEVTGAAFHANVLTGDQVDLAALPIVRHTDQDPYPYTTSFAVHHDPGTGQLNQMFPRCGVLGANEMVASFVTPTANRILAHHRQEGTPMPQAVVIGCHPGWELAGVYSHPHNEWSELDLFESITGEVGEVVRCRTVPLLVPADASVVIEGYVHPTRTAADGPSPGPTMLFTPYVSQQPVFEVTAIMWRDDPVYRNHLMTPFTDHQELPRLFHEAIIYERLAAMGVGVRDVHFPQGGGALCCIIQVDPSMDGQVTDALLSVMGASWLNMKMVVAVDPDIDIYDPRDVQYALATRVDPSRDLIVVDNARGNPFDPTARPVLGALPHTADSRFPSVVGKWGIDATKPVPYRSAERRNFERAWPMGWGDFRLEDYLGGPGPAPS